MPKTTKEAAKKAAKLSIERTIYILAPRKRVWRALTAPLETPQYYFGTRLETKLRRGEPFRYVMSDGKVAIDGELQTVETEAKLVHSFAFTDKKDPPSRVVYTLADVGPKITKLTVLHDGFPRANQTFTSCSDGWDQLLSSLKTYIETNKGIEWPNQAQMKSSAPPPAAPEE